MDRLPFIVALKYDGNRFSIADCLRTGKKPKGKTHHISGHPQAYFGDIKLYINVKQYSKLTIISFTLKSSYKLSPIVRAISTNTGLESEVCLVRNVGQATLTGKT